MSRRPEYSVFQIDLSVAGSQRIEFEAGILVFLTALDASGATNLDALVNVNLGTRKDDNVPMRINGRIIGRIFRYKMTWTAQPNTTAHFLFSPRKDVGEGIEVFAPPARQLVTSAAGTTLATAEVSVTTTATVIAAANNGRQSLLIKNIGAATVYIGPSGVTTATGYPLDAGEVLELSGQTGAVYGRVAAGTNLVRTLEEQ